MFFYSFILFLLFLFIYYFFYFLCLLFLLFPPRFQSLLVLPLFFSWPDRTCGLLVIGNSEGWIGETLRYIDKSKQGLPSAHLPCVCKYNRDWFFSVMYWYLTLWENFLPFKEDDNLLWSIAHTVFVSFYYMPYSVLEQVFFQNPDS